MRFSRITGRHVGPFDTLDLDLDALPGLLVAVTGPNGAGKSTLLELMTGGLLYRDCENRGSLVGLSTARDSFIEGKIVNGAEYTIRHEMDGLARTSESIVRDATGADLLPDRKVSSFDCWNEKHVPSAFVLYASTVAPQKSKGLLEMTRGDRMAVLLRALGCEKLEQRAKEARDAAGDAGKRIDMAEAMLKNEKAHAMDAGVAKAAHDDAVVSLEVADIRSRLAAEALTVARADGEAATKHNAERDRIEGEWVRTRSGFEFASARVGDLRLREILAREALAGEAEVNAAVAELAKLDMALSELRETLSTRTTEERLADERATQSRNALTEARDKARAIYVRIRTGKDKIASAAGLEEESAKLPAALTELGAKQSRVTELEASLEGLRAKVAEGADTRAAALRDVIDWYAENSGASAERAAMTQDADDAWLRDRTSLPVMIQDRVVALARARDEVRGADRRVQALSQAATRFEAVAEWRKLLADLEHDAKAAEASVAEREIMLDATNKAVAIATSATRCAQRLIAENMAARGNIYHLTSRAGGITLARAQIAELSVHIAEADKAHDAAKAARDRAHKTPIPDRKEMPDVDSIEQAAMDTAATLTKALTNEAVRLRDLEQAKEAQVRIVTIEAELTRAREEQSDWTRIASDFEGVKLAEIDAAGPQLTDLANDLLHTCVGPRWTVTVDTQRADAKGKKLIDGVDIRVIDSGDRPREGDGKTFSPGEQVLLNEALSLALAMLYCGRSGIDGVTLVRDETGSALDPENAAAYIAMLRRAAGKIGASRVLFVSHLPSAIELADAWIDVDDGRIEVRS